MNEDWMRKPKVSEIKSWATRYESDLVKVLTDEGTWRNIFFKVVPKGGRVKYFYGESAWSDAERMASDIDFQAWGCCR
jgi:hypothetical protein